MPTNQSKRIKIKQFECLTCGYRTHDRNLLHKHFDTHFYHPSIPIIHHCIYCNQYFGSIAALHRHDKSAGHIKVVCKWSQGIFDLSTMVLFADASLEVVAASFDD